MDESVLKKNIQVLEKYNESNDPEQKKYILEHIEEYSQLYINAQKHLHFGKRELLLRELCFKYIHLLNEFKYDQR